MTAILLYAGLGCVALGLFVMTYILGSSPGAARPELGTRGMKRRMGLEGGGSFPILEPPMRFMAGWFDGMALSRIRPAVEAQIGYAGDYLGLSSNDFMALSLMGAIGLGLTGAFISTMANIPVMFYIVLVIVGAYLPWLQITGEAQARFKQVTRSLPTSIDLAALCMSAGLDFPGAVKQIVDKSSSRDVVIKEEFQRILAELELGHTRAKALQGFADRVPVESVKDFVATVVQAESKGTPLGEVLTIQARSLRQRRSVRAEELAAKAGLMMMAPMMLMFVCIIILLMGPFIIQWVGSGF